MMRLEEFKNKLAAGGWLKGQERLSPHLQGRASVEQFWCFRVQATQDEIWPYLSDTSRFNRALGMPPRTQVEVDGKVVVSTTMLGLEQEWVEEPWTWSSGHTITAERNYRKGIAHKVTAIFHIDDQSAANATDIYIYFSWIPRNGFWGTFLKWTRPLLEKKFADAFARIDRGLKAKSTGALAGLSLPSENILQIPAPVLSSEARGRLQEIRQQLHLRHLNPKCVDQLIDLVAGGDDFDVEPLRLVPLAEKWDVILKDLVVTSLHATRLGLLTLSWDIICPHCRGSRLSAGSLGDIPELSSCQTCELEFSTDGANAIEVVFHIHSSIRKVEKQMFCAAEPAKKSHILVQQLVEPAQNLDLNIELSEGFYRARWVGLSLNRVLNVSGDLGDEVALESLDLFPNIGSVRVSKQTRLRVNHSEKRNLLFVLEDLHWRNQALRPEHVLSVREFRDLFAEEHLNSNVKISLGDQVILFTDIVASTLFYSEVGDAKAFAEVRKHFIEIYREVNSSGGVVVKTIGDAVMAAFASVSQAMQAAIQIQRCFPQDRQDTRIRLRISVHAGPVIAVHLNAGIDYFGNTVNAAAKIQACAGAGEIAMSEVVRQDFGGFDGAIEIRKEHRDGAKFNKVYVLRVGEIGVDEIQKTIPGNRKNERAS